jgi:hypothetical protein
LKKHARARPRGSPFGLCGNLDLTLSLALCDASSLACFLPLSSGGEPNVVRKDTLNRQSEPIEFVLRNVAVRRDPLDRLV